MKNVNNSVLSYVLSYGNEINVINFFAIQVMNHVFYSSKYLVRNCRNGYAFSLICNKHIIWKISEIILTCQKMAENTKNTQSEIIEMKSEQEPSEYSQGDMDIE